MVSSKSLAAPLLGLLGAVAASPIHMETSMTKRSFSCDTLVSGLSLADCQQMSNIGMAGQGANSLTNNGNIWVGSDGPNTFTFTNSASGSPISMTLIVWYNAPNDYSSSFMNVRTPMVSYSLPNTGDSVTVSLADGVSGGFSTITAATTALSQYGQVDNTWGEFTTGDYATIDISREVNMLGDVMSFTVGTNGCHADMNTCAFTCISGNTCGDSGTYQLENCANGSQPGASYGTFGGNPSGGCQGWSNGGHVDVSLGQP